MSLNAFTLLQHSTHRVHFQILVVFGPFFVKITNKINISFLSKARSKLIRKHMYYISHFNIYFQVSLSHKNGKISQNAFTDERSMFTSGLKVISRENLYSDRAAVKIVKFLGEREVILQNFRSVAVVFRVPT